MPLADEIKGDIRAAKKIRLPWWALLCLGIGSFLAAWLFDHLGKFNLVLPTLNCIFVLGFTVAVKVKSALPSASGLRMTRHPGKGAAR